MYGRSCYRPWFVSVFFKSSEKWVLLCFLLPMWQELDDRSWVRLQGWRSSCPAGAFWSHFRWFISSRDPEITVTFSPGPLVFIKCVVTIGSRGITTLSFVFDFPGWFFWRWRGPFRSRTDFDSWAVIFSWLWLLLFHIWVCGIWSIVRTLPPP